MIISKISKVKWWTNNKQWYENLGYTFTKYRDEFEVKVEDLMPCSGAQVELICDYCGEPISVVYVTYLNNRKKTIIQNDCCIKCRPIKSKEVMLLTYGMHSAQVPEIREKYKQTCLDRYGVENVFQDEDIKLKQNKTMVKKYGAPNLMQIDTFKTEMHDKIKEKYGVDNISQSEEIKLRKQETCFSNYGVLYPAQSEEIQLKMRNTMNDRYGVEYPSQSQTIRAKMTESYYKNGTCKTSKQQLEIYSLLLNNGYIVELNYPVSRLNLDVAIFINDIKIDLEYDGIYWHQHKVESDYKRDLFLMDNNWSIIRIIADKEVPSLIQLQQLIQKVIKSNNKKIIYNLKEELINNGK